MKKTLSILLIVSIMLLSGCELGAPGKAYEAGDGYNWVEAYGCRNAATKSGGYYQDDHFISTDKKCEGKILSTIMGKLTDRPIPGYEMNLVSQCYRQTTESKKSFGKVKRWIVEDIFEVVGPCPEGSAFVKKIGYFFKDKPPAEFGESTQYYRCSIDNLPKEVWDRWISSDPRCFSEKLQSNGNLDFVIGWVITGQAVTCDKDIEENKNLKKEIATIQEEIANIKRELETR